MSDDKKKQPDPRDVFDDTFSPARGRDLWTANYLPAIPFTPQGFDIGAVLPAMLYMMRWGTRRGRGKFDKTFGHDVQKKNKASTRSAIEVHIRDIARHMTEKDAEACFENFGEPVGQQILGDLLLASCFENTEHEEGQDKPVLRIYPTHYCASWVDLPTSVAHLRGIPELLVGILVQQDKGVSLDVGSKRGSYPLASGFGENELLRVFGRNMAVAESGTKENRGAADEFVETKADDTGVDELLVIRIAQACKTAPDPAAKTPRGEESKDIPNRKPLPKEAARRFRDDLRVLIEVYGGAIPRQAFLQLFEAAVSLNLTNLLLSTLAMLLHWEEKGSLPSAQDQRPWPLFVDCSNGQDRTLQAWSENGFVEMLRCYERLPVLTMLLRVLDEQMERIRGIVPPPPPKSHDATEFINFLGSFLQSSHPKSDRLFDNLYGDCNDLAKNLEEKELRPDVVDRLRNAAVPEPYRFAESVVELMGKESQSKNYRKALESCLMSDKPSGLSRKRPSYESREGKRSKGKVELSSIVLPPVMLDFLVHRHLHKAGKGNNLKPFLSLQDFLKILRNNYGLYIDQSPPGMTIPQTSLDANARWLERRLRDLGLLIGVNDAPSMKQLKARYPSRNEADEAVSV